MKKIFILMFISFSVFGQYEFKPDTVLYPNNVYPLIKTKKRFLGSEFYYKNEKLNGRNLSRVIFSEKANYAQFLMRQRNNAALATLITYVSGMSLYLINEYQNEKCNSNNSKKICNLKNIEKKYFVVASLNLTFSIIAVTKQKKAIKEFNKYITTKNKLKK